MAELFALVEHLELSNLSFGVGNVNCLDPVFVLEELGVRFFTDNGSVHEVEHAPFLAVAGTSLCSDVEGSVKVLARLVLHVGVVPVVEVVSTGFANGIWAPDSLCSQAQVFDAFVHCIGLELAFLHFQFREGFEGRSQILGVG